MTLAMFASFIMHVLLGLPLFIALLFTAVVGFMFIDPSMLGRMVPQQFFGGINVFSLMAIPLSHSGRQPDEQCRPDATADGPCPGPGGPSAGGLGYVNVVSSVFFAGVNGSAVADTSALGSLLVPAMKKEGYSASHAAGLTAGSSLIGPIIPPSIFMILYASLTNTSVGDLFLAGVIPGLLLGLVFMIANWFYARKAQLPVSGQRPTMGLFLQALWGALPALLAPFIIVGGIVFGGWSHPRSRVPSPWPMWP
ncbi:TRAP transporter large permease subunit [Oceanimonas sp. NS1]|nr:TRAP transporter large permease subunit [Oceanimonas sp. NS1]